uniref:Putative secreted protein n=1 Tax=Lutzomyia longipalpis TaxID=7200 RepID=A0A1B0GI00_LUTLO
MRILVVLFAACVITQNAGNPIMEELNEDPTISINNANQTIDATGDIAEDPATPVQAVEDINQDYSQINQNLLSELLKLIQSLSKLTSEKLFDFLRNLWRIGNKIYKNSFDSYKKCEALCKDIPDRICKQKGILSGFACVKRKNKP